MAAYRAPASSKQHGVWLLLCKLGISVLAMTSSAHGYSPDLSVLAGLSNSEAAEKLSNDPLLLAQLLSEVDIEAASSAMASQETCGSEPGSVACPQAQTITMVDEGGPRFPLPKGIEFLGIGYNFITGNPRGSLSSNLDPGFGFPILDLTARGNTKARGYGMPNISFLKGSKTCTTSREASDITSTRDMQNTLMTESSEDTSLDASVSGSVTGITAGLSTSNTFKSSQKLNQFRKEKETLKTVTLEVKATCVDYQIQISPYASLTLDENFVNAVEALPTTFDATNAENVMLFRNFLSTYGTHYISKMDMGGKYIISSEMTSSDYQSLTTRNVDVKSSYSWDVAFDATKSQTARSNPVSTARALDTAWQDTVDLETIKLLRPSCCNEGETPMPSVAALQEIANEIKGKTHLFADAPQARPAFSISPSVKFSRNGSEREVRNTRDDESVFSEIKRTSVYNLGGTPPSNQENWQSWAATVPDNPMPVAYKSVPIWRMPEFESRRAAYMDAVFYLEGVELDSVDEDGEPSFRYGVIRSSGEAISQYSDSPNRHTRANLELQYLPATQFSSDTVTVYETEQTDESSDSWTPYVGASSGYFACGLRARWDPQGLLSFNDDRGLTGLNVRFCSAEHWTDQEETVVLTGRFGVLQPWKMCRRDQFIVQVRAWTHDNLGIESLEIKCSTVDGHTSPSFSGDGFEDVVDDRRRLSDRVPGDPQPASVIPGKLIKSVRVQFGALISNGLIFSSRDEMGIKGMQMIVRDSDSEGGPPSPIYYYQSYWDVQNRVVSPIFATPIRGKVVINVREAYDQLSITNPKGQLNLESSAMYTFMDEPARPKIAFTDFKNDIEESDLPSFSFLVANDPSEIFMNHDIVSGVVHADGYTISSYSDQSQEVNVSFEDEENPHVATISLGNSFSAATTHVSLLVSPVWFPDAELSYPSNAGDVTVASSPCERVGVDWKCYAHLGTARNLAAESHLGFSFMAVGGMSSSVHGHVKMSGYEVDHAESRFAGGSNATANFDSLGQFRVWAGDGDLTTINLANQITGGVTITFNPPFEDTPSIIISPVVSRSSAFTHAGTDLMYIPHAIVEHVTSEEALVRVGVVDTFGVGLVAKTEACDNLSNVHQTWILKFKVFGQIELGNTPSGRMCFEETADGFVDAKDCDPSSMKQMFVYDGTRIRSYEDPSKCTWIKAGERLHIHQCGSDSDVIDDEPIDFMPHGGDSMSLHTKFDRCLYRRGSEILLSGQSDSACGASAPDRAYSVRVPAGFSNMGFKLATSDLDDPSDPMDFTQHCLSYSMSSQEIQPLGDCDTTSWLLSLDTAGGLNYKIQMVQGNTELYLDHNTETKELSVSSTGSEFNLDSGLFEPLMFFNMHQKLQTSRLRLFGTNDCIQWERDLNDNSIYTVESIFEPVDFNFFVIAPTQGGPAGTGALNKHVEKVASLEEFADSGDLGFENAPPTNLRASIV